MTPLNLAGLLQAGNTDVHHLTDHEPSWWLRSRLVDIDTRWTAGTLRDCRHHTPWPLLVGLWMPDAAWCVPCATTQLRPDGEDNHRCDRCGDLDDSLRVVSLAGRACVVLLGLCADCSTKEVGR